MKEVKRKDRLVFLVFILTALIRVVGYMQKVNFAFRTDDFGTLIYPAALAGYDWRSLVSGFELYYGFGFSWLYTPFFWLFSDGEKIVIAIAMMQSAILVLCSGYVYWLEKRFLKIESDVLRVLGAVSVSLFAGDVSLMHGGSLWYHTDNEVPLFLVIWILTGLLLAAHELEEKIRTQSHTSDELRRVWTRKWVILSSAVALVLAWSLMIHERAMAMVLSVLMAVVLIWLLRGVWVLHPAAFTGTMAAGFILQRIIRHAVISYMWNGGSPSKNTSVVSKVSFGFLTNFLHLKAVMIVIIGNLHSFLIKSYGLPIIAMVVVTLWVFAALIRRFNQKSRLGSDLLGEKAIDKEMLLMLTWGTCILIIIFGGLGVRWGKNIYTGLLENRVVYAYKGICYSRYYFPWISPVLIAVISYVCQKKDVVRRYMWLCWLSLIGIEAVFMWKVYPYCLKKEDGGSSYLRRALSLKLFTSKSNVFNLKICFLCMGLALLFVTVYVMKIKLTKYIKEICLWAAMLIIILTTGANRAIISNNHGMKAAFSFKEGQKTVAYDLKKIVDSGVEMADAIYLNPGNNSCENVIQITNLSGKFKRGLPTEEALSEKNVIVCGGESERLEKLGYHGIPSSKWMIYTNDDTYEQILKES